MRERVVWELGVNEAAIGKGGKPLSGGGKETGKSSLGNKLWRRRRRCDFSLSNKFFGKKYISSGFFFGKSCVVFVVARNIHEAMKIYIFSLPCESPWTWIYFFGRWFAWKEGRKKEEEEIFARKRLCPELLCWIFRQVFDRNSTTDEIKQSKMLNPAPWPSKFSFHLSRKLPLTKKRYLEKNTPRKEEKEEDRFYEVMNHPSLKTWFFFRMEVFFHHGYMGAEADFLRP